MAAEVTDTSEELIKLYPAPTHLRMDNGPEFHCFAEAQGLPQRPAGGVRRKRLQHGLHPARFNLRELIRELFNSRFRDDFQNIELFTSVQEAELLAEQHQIEYNTYRS